MKRRALLLGVLFIAGLALFAGVGSVGCGGPDFLASSPGPEAGNTEGEAAAEAPGTVVICSPCPTDTTTSADAGGSDSASEGAPTAGGDAAPDGAGLGASDDATLVSDVMNPPDGGDAGEQEACVPNACGGCGVLSATVDSSCGTCGSYECDAGSVWCNDPGTTNNCPTWCSSQPIPTGVAARDYQCVDFDNGAPPSSTWVQTVSGGGMLSRSMAEWDSPSYSIMSSVGTGRSDTSTLTWNDVGSTAVSNVSVTAAIDPVTAVVSFGPSWAGQVVLFCISTGHNQTCLNYSWNTGDGGTGFVGYFVSSTYSGGIGIARSCAIPSLATGLWNTVQFAVTPASSSLQMSINGTNSTGNCSAPFDADTNVTVTVGLANSGTIGWPWTAYFDNVVVAIHR